MNTSMIKSISVALAISLLASSVQAEVYSYTCDVIGKKAPLKVDDGKKLLTWQGKQYTIVSTGGNSPFDDNYECAKYCFYATGYGKKLTVSTATQGYADLSEQYGSTVSCEIPKAIYCKGHGRYGRCA
jgi:hypothetical protein